MMPSTSIPPPPNITHRSTLISSPLSASLPRKIPRCSSLLRSSHKASPLSSSLHHSHSLDSSYSRSSFLSPHSKSPHKRRRLFALVDLRREDSVTIPRGGDQRACMATLQDSSALRRHHRPTPISELDAKFVVSQCGLSSSMDGSHDLYRGHSVRISQPLPPAQVVDKATSLPSTSDSVRFPRLDQCAHFHYEYVELSDIKVCLMSDRHSNGSSPSLGSKGSTRSLSRRRGNTPKRIVLPHSEDQMLLGEEVVEFIDTDSVCSDRGESLGDESGGRESPEPQVLMLQVTSLGFSWCIRRSYENFLFLDKQLHKCCYDRRVSELTELPPEGDIASVDRECTIRELTGAYLSRLSAIAGPLITCGPVLSWLELDNRGHRLIVTDDSDINTPAVAAAYVIRRYVSQAQDEIGFEVGDMISVIDMPPSSESVWWRGKRGFQVGFFPYECVQVIGDKVPTSLQRQRLQQTGGSCDSNMAPSKPVLRKHGKLIAFFRSFILSRPSRRKLKRQGILKERVFGCDLGEHLMNSGHELPMVLKCCAEFIESNGTVDGIYRLSGITSNIQKLRNAFDEDRVPELYSDESIVQDIHCVSSVLKMYFRELPNPLLTYQLYDRFVLAVSQEESIRLLHIRDVVQQLPPPHYRTLRYLIEHLSRVACHSSDTGMTPKNIAIVWAPNLLRCKDLEKGGVAALQDVGTQAVVTEYLIRYVDLIFSDKLPALSVMNFEENSPGKGKPSHRPKSLAISTPAKLISIEEARQRALNGPLSTHIIKPDQKYIEVGGGPQSLPKVYHTVIDLPRKGGGSLKHKKSPSGWKSIFTGKTKHSCNKENEEEEGALRPGKSVECLVSSQPSENTAAIFVEEMEVCSEVSPPSPCSPKTHNRSFSHDSYFNLFGDGEKALKQPKEKTLTEETEAECKIRSSGSMSKIFLEINELNLDFNTSESEMKIFSEDDTLKSTSIGESTSTLSKFNTDLEDAELGSDCHKQSLKDKLKTKFTRSPIVQRKNLDEKQTSTEYWQHSQSMRGESSITTPEMPRKKQRYALNKDVSDLRTDQKVSLGVEGNALKVEEFDLKSLVSEEDIDRSEISCTLIDADLMKKLTHLRSSSNTSSGSSPSIGENITNASDNDTFTGEVASLLSTPSPSKVAECDATTPRALPIPSVTPYTDHTNIDDTATDITSELHISIESDRSETPEREENLPPPVTSSPPPVRPPAEPSPPPVRSSPPVEPSIVKAMRLDLPPESQGSVMTESCPVVLTDEPSESGSRPLSLVGMTLPNAESATASANISPVSHGGGDMISMDIQYHPLSDTTEPSTGNTSPACDLTSHPPFPVRGGRLSPSISSDNSSGSPPLYENVPDDAYENVSTNTMKRRVSVPKKPDQDVTYENVDNGVSEVKDLDDGEYEQISFGQLVPSEIDEKKTEDISAVDIECRDGEEDHLEAVIVDGEVVYQQVKYLRQSIQEVNNLIDDVSNEQEKCSLKSSSDKCTEAESTETVPTESHSLGSPIDKPPPPVTKQRIISSPTSENRFEVGEQSSLPPIPLPRKSISQGSRRSSDSKSPPSSLSLRKESLNLNLSSSEKEPKSEASTEVTSLSSSESSPLGSKNKSKESPLPPLLRHKTSPDLLSPSSLDSCVPVFSHEAEDVNSGEKEEEDEATKRERIEKYKEERRMFLREKFKSESFRGQTDDVILRLKQKASSPSRSFDGEFDANYLQTLSSQLEKSEDTKVEKEPSVAMTESSTAEEITISPTEDVNVKERIAVWAHDKPDSEKPCETSASLSNSYSQSPNQSSFTKLKPMKSLPISSINFSSVCGTSEKTDSSRQSLPAKFTTKSSVESKGSTPPSPTPKFYSFKPPLKESSTNPVIKSTRTTSSKASKVDPKLPTSVSPTAVAEEIRNIAILGTTKLAESPKTTLDCSTRIRSSSDCLKSRSDTSSINRSIGSTPESCKFSPDASEPFNFQRQSSLRGNVDVPRKTVKSSPETPKSTDTSNLSFRSMRSSQKLETKTASGVPFKAPPSSSCISQQRKIKDMAAMFESNK